MSVRSLPAGHGGPIDAISSSLRASQVRTGPWTVTMYSAEEILLPLQRLQLAHDQAAHFDMLAFDLHKRLKHMVLHFFKYAGKIESARDSRDNVALRAILLDTFVICVATANALNLSLGKHVTGSSETKDLDGLAAAVGKRFPGVDLYTDAVRQLVLTGGRMAKAIESLDHMERGDCRAAMESLVPELTTAVIGLLGRTPQGLEDDLRARLASIEQRSIFAPPAAG